MLDLIYVSLLFCYGLILSKNIFYKILISKNLNYFDKINLLDLFEISHKSEVLKK